MSSDNIRTTSLSRLKRDVPGLTEPIGSSFIEACMVCFDDVGHTSGVHIEVKGSYNTTFAIVWEGQATDQMILAWGDEDVTTENAAYGIAILLIEELTGYTAIERADKGFGFDYWLGNPTDDPRTPYKRLALLEVSGIRRGNISRIETRVKQKERQTELSNGDLPAYVAVIEFGKPLARIVKR